MKSLQLMREKSAESVTKGLSDSVIESFLKTSPDLVEVVNNAFNLWKALDPKDTYAKPEATLIEEAERGWCIFYAKNYRTPYIPLAAKGSWVVTLHGAVLNDSGGYGMLGFGHAPDAVIDVMSQKLVMANIMTPSLAHINFQRAIRAEVGQTRPNSICPYDQFLLMNSGSEANSVVDRIIDVYTGHLKGNRQFNRFLTVSLIGGFHGRTFKPAVWGHSNTDNYLKHRVSSINATKAEQLRVVPPNDCLALERVFKEAKEAGDFIELVVMEPVMGEGNPGERITPEFYACARKLTLENNAFLLVDSVQAGFRATGYFSVVDFPGFSSLQAPDFETWSKAINAGQYPVSLVGLTARAAEWHRPGIYGNTMTGNPRACEVATTVLRSFTPQIRKNILEIGEYAVQRFKALQIKYPAIIKAVSGAGLLYAVHMDKVAFPVTDDKPGQPCAERWMRINGIGVIHGGENALRFTPHFRFTRAEVDLQVAILDQYIATFVAAPVAVEVTHAVKGLFSQVSVTLG